MLLIETWWAGRSDSYYYWWSTWTGSGNWFPACSCSWTPWTSQIFAGGYYECNSWCINLCKVFYFPILFLAPIHPVSYSLWSIVNKHPFNAFLAAWSNHFCMYWHSCNAEFLESQPSKMQYRMWWCFQYPCTHNIVTSLWGKQGETGNDPW